MKWKNPRNQLKTIENYCKKVCFSSSISNWNKYQSKVPPKTHNGFLDYVIDPGFQGTIVVFLLSFEDATVTIGQAFFKIDGKNIFNRFTKISMKTHKKIITTTF